MRPECGMAIFRSLASNYRAQVYSRDPARVHANPAFCFLEPVKIARSGSRGHAGRQLDDEVRAPYFARCHADAAAMLLDHRADLRQAKTRALLFGGKKRLEQMGTRFL